MVSGKYSALAGAVARDQAISNISANLSNVNTSGYRRTTVSFESLLRGEQQAQQAKGINYSRVNRNVTDFSQGAMRQTENPFHAAINGAGFFKIEGPDGPIYTRRGDFLVDQEGILKTSSGLPVLDDAGGQITIPDTDTGELMVIAEDGTISMVAADGTETEAGRIAIVDVEDKTLLRREAETGFTLEAGGVEEPVENPIVSQGFLELSNVNMTDEMTKMINSSRLFETYHKVLESYSTLGQQLDDLGSVG